MLYISCKQCYVSSIGIGHFLPKKYQYGEKWYRCITNDFVMNVWTGTDRHHIHVDSPHWPISNADHV